MKKFLITIGVALTLAISGITSANIDLTATAVAAGDDGGNHATILPDAKNADCEKIMNAINGDIINARKAMRTNKVFAPSTSTNEILGCAIKTGDIKFFMIPFFIKYILEFIIYVVGFLSMLGIIYGGYNYLFAGLSEDKDSGKNAIKNSLIGLVLSILAWPIVNIVLGLLT